MKIQKSVLLIFTFIFALSICGCAVTPTDGDATGADVAGGDLVSPSSAPDKGETENDPSAAFSMEEKTAFGSNELYSCHALQLKRIYISAFIYPTITTVRLRMLFI